ncbi:hypothetical protein [Streptomyces thermolilacinus]|uniref:hypothetical protein n=1 Tax=Streptomyces thermolilacinus TaxID=285540 RepID=UPI0033CE16D2
MVVLALLLLVFVPAPVRVLLTGADRRAVWSGFRCLPGTVRAGLAALVLSGVVMTALTGVGEDGLRDAEAKGGRFFALDTSPGSRGEGRGFRVSVRGCPEE